MGSSSLAGSETYVQSKPGMCVRACLSNPSSNSVPALTRPADLSTPDPFDSIVTGQQRARGFELELAANPIPGLEIVLAYTFINAEVTKDNVIPIGTPLQGVPANSFSAWVKYTIQEG